MANNNMSDNLDDFFDFEQLEQDSRLYSDLSNHQHGEPEISDLAAMDWQPTAADRLLQEERFEGSYDQWIVAESPCQPLSHSSTDLVALPWPTSQVPAVADHPPSLELTAAPSSSLQTVGEVGHLTNGTVPHCASLTNDAVVKPSIQIPGPTSKKSSVDSRASLPTRHAASAGWKPASAKRKGPQSRIPLEAKQILEDEFATNPYPCNWEYDIIAHQANLEVKKVRTWFNNTRARKKGEGMFSFQSSSCILDSHIQTLLLPTGKGFSAVFPPSGPSSAETAWRHSIFVRTRQSNHLNHL
jgi:hypothetical protein